MIYKFCYCLILILLFSISCTNNTNIEKSKLNEIEVIKLINKSKELPSMKYVPFETVNWSGQEYTKMKCFDDNEFIKADSAIDSNLNKYISTLRKAKLLFSKPYSPNIESLHPEFIDKYEELSQSINSILFAYRMILYDIKYENKLEQSGFCSSVFYVDFTFGAWYNSNLKEINNGLERLSKFPKD